MSKDRGENIQRKNNMEVEDVGGNTPAQIAEASEASCTDESRYRRSVVSLEQRNFACEISQNVHCCQRRQR